MATIEQLSAALIKADAAGNTEDARILANEIRRMNGSEEKPKPSFGEMLKNEAMASLPGGVLRGIKDVLDTGAELAASGYDKITGSDDLTLSNLVTGEKGGESARVRAMNVAGKKDFKEATERTGRVIAPAVGRVLGNIVGTAPAISAGGATLTAAGLPRLGAAFASGGMSTGARVAPGFTAGLGDLSIRVAGGAGSGSLAAGMVDPESAGFGAAIGGAIPVVSRVAGAAGRAVGNVVSERAARTNAAQRVAQTLGDDVQQAIGDIQTYYPRGAERIPVSAAGITGNPALATLEQGSRVRGSPAWYDFDQRQARAVFDNVMQATDEAEQLAQRLGTRRENWQQAWQKAAESQKPKLWQARMMQFADNIDRALVAPDASNPAVRGVLDAIAGEIDRVGPNFTIGNLQQIRANLNGRANPMSPDAFKAAPRDSSAVRSIIKEIDDILNVSTSGKWQNVIEGYARDSQLVQAAKAASKVRGSFVDEATGQIRGVSADPRGDVAKITEAGLGRAIDAARLPDKSLALSGNAIERLNATREALRRQNIVQGVKRTATAGGGSDTISNQFAAEGLRSAGSPNILLQLMQGIQQLGTRNTDEQMARLLSNPDELAAALTAINRAPEPNALTQLVYRGAPVISARP